ncbi:AAA family ATPase, partial [Lusitaniella coriacea LEGE 07157]
KLGERDICDHFLIPEKLYGREGEVQVLLNAFERVAEGNSEMMLVAGFSGIGKTAVVHEVHKPIVKNRGYFIKGKFDQFNRNIPFSAFVQAFRSLMGQILSESDAELQGWKTKILEAVGNNGQVLIDVIPELETIIGKQSPVPELSGSVAQNRFNLLFEKFIAIFTTKEHPLVIFLDDLQWADSASLDLMKVLMGDSDRGYLLLLGAYRDNEVFPAHPLMLTLVELVKQEATISTITLASLSLRHINQLVAETLSCNVKKAQPLTELVYQKTQGNPFFATQFLKGLYEDDLIAFNPNLRSWECDLVKVRDAALTDDVVKFMAGRLQKLPEATQEVLKLAACIGNQFDLETLAIVRESSSEEVASELWSALQEGMVLPISEAYKFFQGEIKSTEAETVAVNYRFLHDRVQQAAYSLIPDEQKQATHYCIGKLLLRKIPPAEREERIFELVSQLNYGTTLIREQKERNDLACLNLIACRKARATTAYQAGQKYAITGLFLLGESAWQQQYELALAFHNLAAELALLCGNFEEMEQWIEVTLQQAKTALERIEVYVVKIQALTCLNQLLEAIDFGLFILKELGFSLPKNPSGEDIQRFVGEIDTAIASCSIKDLFLLPEMVVTEKLAAMQISASIFSACYITGSPLFAIVAAFQVKLSIESGNSPHSAFSYACYGVVLNNLCRAVTTGTQFGQLAYRLVSETNSQKIRSETCALLGLFVWHRKSHLQETLPIFQTGYQAGLETGQLEYASYNATGFCLNAYWCGCSLAELEKQIHAFYRQVLELNQTIAANGCLIYLHGTLFLLGNPEKIELCFDEVDKEKAMVVESLESKDFNRLFIFYIHRTLLRFWMGEIYLANTDAIEARKYILGGAGEICEAGLYFYDSLIALALVRVGKTDWEMQQQRVGENQIQLQYWAENAPMNYQHKYDLVEAEKCRILGQKLEAIEIYDRAITGAKENDFIQEEALANELFAKFYLDWDKEQYAALHMQEAYYCYAQWGAKAKTNDLEQRYPELLKPILQRASHSGSLSSTSSTSLSTVSSHSQTAAITNISSLLDFSSLLKASQILSGEIELDRLLSTLMEIILENAGATKGALLLIGEQGLTVDAIATRQNENLQLDSVHQSIPLQDYQDLPIGLINTVRRTTQTALLDAKTAQEKFTADRYLRRFFPQSLLCMPLLERGNLIGILYLENNLTADAFTRDRVELLDALCAQAAISLNNARLYQKAQQALQDLQKAQLQLVQNEKMATLGNLVAGVAHEINNPLSFIGGNVNAAKDYIADLFEILQGYQEELPNPSPELEELLEDLDLDFIEEDLPKLMGSMSVGCDRIGNISTSLRTFSRTDTDVKTEFNLHEGIESTLLILKYRLKANEERPAIDIVKEYGDIPEVKCCAGQINQVFMNLIANAIDALEDGNEGKTFAEIEQEPNCITVGTELSEDKQSILVRIGDNGLGMPEEVREKIFEQGFTTKGVGKGTGLGLAIARQIIEEKHGGSLEVQSELGQETQFCIRIPISG